MSFLTELSLKDILEIQKQLLQQTTLLDMLIRIQERQQDQLVLISKQLDAMMALSEEKQ